MANFSKNTNDWLDFSKSERWAILIFSGLIIIFNLFPIFYAPNKPDPWIIHAIQNEVSETSNTAVPSTHNVTLSPARNEKKLSPVRFNPNLVTKEQLIEMGLDVKKAGTWIHYLQKGGRFYKAEDLRKLYGLSPETVDQLMPFVDLPQKDFSKYKDPNLLALHKEHSNLNLILDINLADSADWEKLPGIGPTLAKRILLFREKLGGFYKLEQVAETFGLQDSVFIKIKPHMKVGVGVVRKININQADWATLKDHPYIRSQLASAILKYRKAHGLIKHREELNELMQLNRDQLEKLIPYLNFEG